MQYISSRSEYVQRLRVVFPQCEAYMTEIEQAFDLAEQAHAGQLRKYEGVPFLTHPIAVSLDVAEKYQDKVMVIAGLLHDTVEDCDDVDIEDIYASWGEEVGLLVEAVTKVPLFFIDQPDVVYRDKIEKLLAGGMRDVRVLLLKIADRDHNLSTLEGLKPHKQIRMTFETQAIYQPLKHILSVGVSSIDISSCIHVLQVYLIENFIDNVRIFKEKLYDITFKGLDEDSFKSIYQNTLGVIWKLEDKSVLLNLIKHPHFSERITIVKMQEDSEGGFKAYLRYNKANVFEGFTGKFSYGHKQIVL